MNGTTENCQFVGGHAPGYDDTCAHCHRAKTEFVHAWPVDNR